MAPRPLSVLLSHALIAFERDYDQVRAGAAAPLSVWSNLLRVIGHDGVDLRELPGHARISRRAMRMALERARRKGWVEVEAVPGPPRRKLVRLTNEGRAAHDAGSHGIRRAEARWRTQSGDEDAAELLSSLQRLVGRLKLELPHYPAGYGLEDDSVTGGLYVKAVSKSPDIPVHGDDWPVVRRDAGDTTAGLGLSALLSQTLVAFAIDYESRGAGSLETAANVLQAFDGGPLPLDRVPPIAGVTGSGRSRLERHGIVVVTRDPAAGRVASLTERGRHMLDSYESLVADVGQVWEARYGADVVRALTRPLNALVPRLDNDLPKYPSGTAWLRWS